MIENKIHVEAFEYASLDITLKQQKNMLQMLQKGFHSLIQSPAHLLFGHSAFHIIGEEVLE